MFSLREAKAFAEEWITTWNSHDLDRIMDYYADSFQHVTPKLMMLFGASTHTITDKKDLRDYFEAGLKRAPELRFTLREVYVGAESVMIVFSSTTGVTVALMLVLDHNMKITQYRAHYRD